MDLLARAEPTSVQPEALGEHLVEVQSMIDHLQGVASEWTGSFAQAGGYEQAGSPTLAAWMRQHLRHTPAEARRRVRAARTLQDLLATRAALSAGRIAHVDAIAMGVAQLGSASIAAVEPIILEVAETCDADAVKTTIARVRDTLDPDAADAAYVRTLDRRDLRVSAVGDGYLASGFLDPETGALFQEVLYSAAKPTDKDDRRTAGQRRVDGLRDLCRSILDHGRPSDRGLRPHLFVTTSAERLKGGDAASPAELHGFGAISDLLLSKLACDCSLTPVLVDGDGPQANVLDVGRTVRLATLKQRQAIHVQQGGVCFAPGCTNTHLEIHHLVAWTRGGPTDMANLRGYCTRCHHLIHLGLLVVSADGAGGWTHRTRVGTFLPDHRRRAERRTHSFVRERTQADP